MNRPLQRAYVRMVEFAESEPRITEYGFDERWVSDTRVERGFVGKIPVSSKETTCRYVELTLYYVTSDGKFDDDLESRLTDLELEMSKDSRYQSMETALRYRVARGGHLHFWRKKDGAEIQDDSRTRS